MSHQTRATGASTMMSATTYGQPPHTMKISRLPLDKSSTASQRYSMTSTSSSTQRSSSSLEGPIGPTSSRPSGIPRPTRVPSTTRSGMMTSSKSSSTLPQRPKVSRNISDTSVRTTIRNRSTDRVNIANSAPRIVSDDDLLSLESNLPALDIDHDTVFGIAVSQKHLIQPPHLPPRLIPELQALAATVQRKAHPAASTISTVSSPSTQFTTSPGPWSASTTATTPTSWSSTSPGLVQSTRPKLVSKRSQTVPIPAAVRTQMPKLPVLQESTRSSASSAKAVQVEEVRTPKKSKKKSPVDSPAPTPPPRTSSVKRGRSRSNSKTEDQAPADADVIPPLPREEEISPVVKHVEATANRQNNSSQIRALTDNHKKLQDAINSAPSRPSRDGTDGIEFRRPQIVNVRYAKTNDAARKLLEAAPIEALPQTSSQITLPMTKSSEPEVSASSQTSGSRLGKFSKLAFFGRSPKKAPADPEPSQRSRKLQRKGPSAGTGHEGYSRFGRRDRRTSNDGNTTATDSETSVVSTNRKPMPSVAGKESSSSARRDRSSQSDLDDFVASRLQPVVILGGSQKLNESFISNSSKPDVGNSSKNERNEEPSNIQDDVRHVSVTSSGPLMRESRLIFHLDSLDAQDQPRLAVRRSQKFDNSGSFRLPEPINIAVSYNQPFLSGYNTSQSSLAPTSAALTDTGSDLYKVDSRLLEKQRKKGRKLNWGFFKKKEFIPETYQPRSSSRPAAPKMAVRISAVPPPRPMPYYAMLESESESNNTTAIEDFLTEAARSMPKFEDDGTVSSTEDLELVPEPRERAQSILLPTAPKLIRTENANTQNEANDEPNSFAPNEQTPVQLEYKPRQPRLAQVGRIPKVVPSTQSATAMQASFSTQPQPEALNARRNNFSIPIFTSLQRAPAEGVIEGSRYIPNGQRAKPSPSMASQGMVGHLLPASRIMDKEILKLPDRYSTTSSSSDGVISVMGPPLLPAPEFPTSSIRHMTTEDDVWNEYDDFIDHVTSPPRLKKSRTRITDGDRIHPMSIDMYKLPVEQQFPLLGNRKNLVIDTSLRPPPLLFNSSDTVSSRDLDQELRLRRSRIVSALHSSLDPSSPYSIGDYLAELGEPSRNSGHASGRYSDSTLSQSGPLSPRTMFSFPEPPLAQFEYRHHDNVVHVDELERSKDPEKHSDRSYASLMVSKWLSSGQVLLSPAHNDLQKQPERHVLVIDGLGNDDWSIYCAVTYQTEQALIYDLKETGHTCNSSSPTKTGSIPQNFRRRELTSFNETFKFPDNFFSVIVLRFPPVMAESKLKNIVSECRRVLAPGGYMELMLLDIDIVNMGVLTRRAMRELKTKIAMRNREVSLKPVIDNVQSVLGEKGFSKLRRCFVGVPVVGKPPGAESSTSSRSSGASEKFRKNQSSVPRPFDQLERTHDHTFSLHDLVADHSDNADAKIGRVVSRTARSWWQHCFEAAVISDGGLSKSIFADKQVLRECKSRASSFKLLIGYTQKPANPAFGGKRRTMSEPVIATLATAGSPKT